MKKLLIFTLFLITLNFFSCEEKVEKVKIDVNGEIFSFELADTPEERAQGLMFRKTLESESGMLFVFSREKFLHFYMKNTLVPLDIAYIDAGFNVIDILSMDPLDESTVSSSGKVRYALEVNRGFFDVPESVGVKEFESKVSDSLNAGDMDLFMECYELDFFKKNYKLKEGVTAIKKKALREIFIKTSLKLRLREGDKVEILTPIAYTY